jgi:hypothetical protein
MAWFPVFMVIACAVITPLWVRIFVGHLRSWSASGVVTQRRGNIFREIQPLRFYYILVIMALGAALPPIVTIALAARLMFGR